MDILEAIAARRSVRKFTDRPVTEETVNAVLAAAILAPSGKNHQSWRFVVVAGAEKRTQMIRVMREGITDTKARGIDTGSAIMTARVMDRAPVTIFRLQPGRCGSLGVALACADSHGNSRHAVHRGGDPEHAAGRTGYGSGRGLDV